MVSNQDMSKHRDAVCTGLTPDKNNILRWEIRSSSTPSACLPQRWKTDAAILAYLRKKTNIPLPRLQHTFEDDGAF
ncbi:hypothetical protein V2G26_001769 [Clonostachys chloroleuca]